MNTFSLTTALANDIVGQKRTGKTKQFVFIQDEFAIKGPYQQGRLNNVVTRSQIFTAWNTPCVVKAIDYFTVPDGIFVRYPNIMAGYPLESELYTESFSGLQYRILKNPPVTDIGHALASNLWIPSEAEDLLLALCHCNILGIGDMNMRNTMVDPIKHIFYVIDFDDNLGADRDDEVFYFNKKPGKKMMWYENVAIHYNKVADRLIPLLTDNIVVSNNLVPRVQRAIDLLRKYTNTGYIAPQVLFINSPNTAIRADPGLQETDTERDVNGIYFFNKGKYYELSNYWTKKNGDILFSIDGVNFKSSEHAYQYYKFSYPGADQNTLQYAEIIRNSNTPNDAKLLGGQKLGKGYQAKMNDNIRAYKTIAIMNPNWENIKLDVMRAVISYKFTTDPHCQQVLLATSGHMLYEDSPYDSFWGIGKDGKGQNWLGKILVEFRDKLNPTGILPTTKPLVLKVSTPKGPAILEIPGPITQDPIKDQVNVQMEQPVGQMVWKGLRGGASKTYSGIDFDVAKSALQKYIRRNMPQKALLAAIELYRMGEVGGDPGVSNMYNRLAIIANEDIGPANLPLVLEVTRLVESGDRDIYKLVTMVQLMSESSKTRMMSHAWRAYANPEGRATAILMGLPVDSAFTESDTKFIAENMNSDLFSPGDPENIRPYPLIFLKRLYEKDFNSFSWAYFFLEVASNLTIPKRKKFILGNTRSTTGKASILLWKALSKVLPPETHDILVDAYYNHTENRPFLQNAILIALYSLPYKKLDLTPYINIWKDQPVLHQMLTGEFPLEIDAFAIDKHTQQGRSKGMGIKEFVDDGAAVANQDPTYYNKLLEDIYRTRG